jgi:lysozyme
MSIIGARMSKKSSDPAKRRLFSAPTLLCMAGLALSGCGSDSAITRDYTHVGTIAPPKSQFSATYPHDFPVHGIDVSKYQGDIDWQSVRASGIEFAYIKATEGADRTDVKFAQNWTGAQAAGLKRGAYHFAYWCRTPEEEMANFTATVPRDPDALPPVLDVEATPTSGTCKKTLYRDATIAQMRRMLEIMERTYGKRPVIYTTVDFYHSILHPIELEEYPIWVRSTKYSPHVRYGSRKWHFWQYQSDARIPGIRGNVDRNAFAGDRRQWLAFAAGGEHSQTAVAYAPAPQAIPANVTALAPQPPALQPIPGAVASPVPVGLKPPASLGVANIDPDD